VRKDVGFACVYNLINNSLARLQEMAKGRLRLDLDSTLYTLYVLYCAPDKCWLLNNIVMILRLVIVYCLIIIEVYAWEMLLSNVHYSD
jgi:hypothetical protein